MIVAILTPRRGALEQFRAYEAKAAGIMARYEGRIQRTVVVNEQPPMREVHIVSFPDLDAFQRYRTDPDLAALAEVRAACIEHTELLLGREGPDYMALPG